MAFSFYEMVSPVSHIARLTMRNGLFDKGELVYVAPGQDIQDDFVTGVRFAEDPERLVTTGYPSLVLRRHLQFGLCDILTKCFVPHSEIDPEYVFFRPNNKFSAITEINLDHYGIRVFTMGVGDAVWHISPESFAELKLRY